MPGPPEDWDAEEATERVRVVTHAYPEHQRKIEEVLAEIPKKPHPCKRCQKKSVAA